MAMASSSTGNWVSKAHTPLHLSSPCIMGLGFASKPASFRTRPSNRGNKIRFALNSTSVRVLHFPQENAAASPEWNILQKAAAAALDFAESALVSRERQHPLPKTVDPSVQIIGNFAPVPEQPVQHDLPVTGTIPECINGVYLRNGANPLHEPVSGHHLFDGDGMVHAVRIDNGTASYC